MFDMVVHLDPFRSSSEVKVRVIDCLKSKSEVGKTSYNTVAKKQIWDQIFITF